MNKFNFYEIVKIVSKNPNLSEVNGKEATILAMAENDDGTWGYGVTFSDDDSEGWYIDEVDLVTLNRFAKEEDFYTGETMSVVVTPDGKGHIKHD